jgi:hypothetical protein
MRFHFTLTSDEKRRTPLKRLGTGGDDALDQFNLSRKERDWAQQFEDASTTQWTRRLSKRLKPGISFKAIPAVFASGS